jgi:GNAT superfamily N-acetyltransferase
MRPKPTLGPVNRSLTIRDGLPGEAAALEDLQRRSSDVWEAYREQLAAHPAAIALPQAFIDNGWVRVAADAANVAVGFSVVIPSDGGVHELDGLFVEPAQMYGGIGRALIDDAVAQAVAAGATRLEVTAGPARIFYEKVGFSVISTAQTQFGPALRMRRDL